MTRFTIVGAGNFGITLIVFYVLVDVIKANYLASLVATWAIGMLFSYTLNFAWVFKPEEKLEFKKRFLKYFAASVVSIGCNLVGIRFLVQRTALDPFWAQAALIPPIVAFNFLTAKFWSLRANRA